jgi:hypothetical protein
LFESLEYANILNDVNGDDDDDKTGQDMYFETPEAMYVWRRPPPQLPSYSEDDSEDDDDDEDDVDDANDPYDDDDEGWRANAL